MSWEEVLEAVGDTMEGILQRNDISPRDVVILSDLMKFMASEYQRLYDTIPADKRYRQDHPEALERMNEVLKEYGEEI